jgi:hypothetical protein
VLADRLLALDADDASGGQRAQRRPHDERRRLEGRRRVCADFIVPDAAYEQPPGSRLRHEHQHGAGSTRVELEPDDDARPSFFRELVGGHELIGKAAFELVCPRNGHRDVEIGRLTRDPLRDGVVIGAHDAHEHRHRPRCREAPKAEEHNQEGDKGRERASTKIAEAAA